MITVQVFFFKNKQIKTQQKQQHWKTKQEHCKFDPQEICVIVLAYFSHERNIKNKTNKQKKKKRKERKKSQKDKNFFNEKTALCFICFYFSLTVQMIQEKIMEKVKQRRKGKHTTTQMTSVHLYFFFLHQPEII